MSRIDELTRSLAEDAAGWLDAETLDDLDRALRDDPDAVIPDEARTRAIAGALHPFTGKLEDAERRREEREMLIAMARKAIDELRRLGGTGFPLARLDDGAQAGAALLALLVARPAIPVAGGTFPAPRTKPWDVLDGCRPQVETMFPRVGRIEVPALEYPSYAGTGFVVGDGLVLTNRHVLKPFAWEIGGRWTLREGRAARIDFGEELAAEGASAPADDGAATTFAIEEVLGCHDAFDLALLKVAGRSVDGQRDLPTAVTLAPDGSGVREAQSAFLVGYPGREEKNPEPSLMDGLFESIYYVKRLQPGTVMHVITDGDERGILQHDCSTLAGNSGSCLADLATGDVIGLHYAGMHGRFNLAVALWMLRDDPFLSRFEVHWAA
ncbi:MAG TPA: serine protease [Thermoanaerobaculia bacterium]|nr:serine protease [Thermoanaerobaculia bacterium]